MADYSSITREQKMRHDQTQQKLNEHFQKLAVGDVDADPNAMKKLTALAGSCKYCGANRLEKGVKLSACTGCQIVFYCSKKCQKAHWESHKIHCAEESKHSGFKEEIALEFPQRATALGHLRLFQALISAELDTAMMYAMRVGYENARHLTHSAYFIFNYDETQTELRRKFTFVRAGIETIAEGIDRIYQATFPTMRNMEKIKASFTQDHLLEGLEHGIPMPDPHAFVGTIQVLGMHKHGTESHQGVIAHLSGPIILSVSETISLMRPPALEDNEENLWADMLRASLARPQPRSRVDTEIIFASLVLLGVDEFFNLYCDVRDFQASSGYCEPHWTPRLRVEQKRKVQALLPHVRVEVEAMETLMTIYYDEEQAVLAAEKKRLANAKKKARKQRAAERPFYPPHEEQVKVIMNFAAIPENLAIVNHYAARIWRQGLPGVEWDGIRMHKSSICFYNWPAEVIEDFYGKHCYNKDIPELVPLHELAKLEGPKGEEARRILRESGCGMDGKLLNGATMGRAVEKSDVSARDKKPKGVAPSAKDGCCTECGGARRD